jgi:hypothetical protein
MKKISEINLKLKISKEHNNKHPNKPSSSWIFNMNIEHKNAVGTFPNFQEIESALRQLKATGFHMNNVSVVAEHLDSASDILARSTDSTIQSEDGFVWGNTVERIEHGALDAGAMGSVVGGVVAGLTTLAFSAFSGAVVLVVALALILRKSKLGITAIF